MRVLALAVGDVAAGLLEEMVRRSDDALEELGFLVTVSAVDEGGRPAPDAEVRVLRERAGRWVEVPPARGEPGRYLLPRGRYRVEARAPGYETAVGEFPVEGRVEVTVRLRRAREARGVDPIVPLGLAGLAVGLLAQAPEVQALYYLLLLGALSALSSLLGTRLIGRRLASLLFFLLGMAIGWLAGDTALPSVLGAWVPL
ncbi:MAG: hypothetical protein DRO06_01865, partial [Thermoproteota archaeon]